MIRGINHFGINSADVDRLADFYRAALGFTDAADEFAWRDNAVIDGLMGLKGTIARQRMLRAGNCYLELFEYSAPEPRAGDPLRPCDRGYTHLAIDVADIDSEIARLKGVGMRFLIDAPIELGPLRAIYGLDPDGNLIELIEAPDDHPYSLAQLG